MVSHIDQILETIDHDTGTPAGGIAPPMNTAQCSRTGCIRATVDGHDFCPPCLAWLRFESDDDPLGRQLPEETVNPEDDYYAWVQAMCGH